MPKKDLPMSLHGEDRFNIMLALVGFLQRRGSVSLEEASLHFDLDKKYLRKLVTSLNEARASVGGFEQWFFFIDVDELESNGNLMLVENLVIDKSPKLSNRQASAIAAGLNYLSTLPMFATDADLIQLQGLLSDGTHRGGNPMIAIRPGSPEAGAELLRTAIIGQNKISCEYMNQKGERANRIIEPLRLDPRPEGWYLRGYCPVNLELRNFRLDRMRGIQILTDKLGEEALKINEIDDALYLADSTDLTVTVEVEPEAYRLVSEFVTLSEPTDSTNGKIRADIKIGHLPNLGRLVAKFGGSAKVISPAEARLAVKNYALAAIGQTPEPEIDQALTAGHSKMGIVD